MGTKLGKINSELKQTVKITAEEYSMIKAIWNRVEVQPKIHGTGFYLRFFAKYPQYIKYFFFDPLKEDVNPDALMVAKFTLIMEILGYLILDYHDRPKQFNQLIGYLGMMHKDMQIDLEDMNKFCTALIEYLKEAMTDLINETYELAAIAFFHEIQQLMIKSIVKERQRFDQDEEDDALVAHSGFKALLPCTCSDRSRKIYYGQTRDYWILREVDWRCRISSWEQEMQMSPVTANVLNTAESTSSEDDTFEKTKVFEGRDFTGREKLESFIPQRATYLDNKRIVSIPYFEQRISDVSVFDGTTDLDDNDLINNTIERSIDHAKLTPRERRRNDAAMMKSFRGRPSARFISSTDTGSPRYSDESSARERRRRSTWS